MRLQALLLSGLLSLGLALALVTAPPLAAREITPAEEREWAYEAKFPVCHDPRVLERISETFAERESRFWQSALTIGKYEHIRPVAWRPWGLDYIPRRYCTAVAWTSDGRKRQVDYSVREDLAFSVYGLFWGVEWCVRGLDRNAAYTPHCRMARP